MNKPLLTTVKDGQSYVDEPVYIFPLRETILEANIRQMFQRRPLPSLLTHYERVILRWLKLGRDGKLVPR